MSATPYYEDEAVTLYCGRFEDLLPDVLARHGEPDLTLTDPPYGETSLAWDRWPDGWPDAMPGRSMWVFGSMRMFLDHRAEFSTWKHSQDVVWRKPRGSGFTNDRFVRVHEHVVHWYRDDWAAVHHDTPRVGYAGPQRSGFVRSAGAERVHGARGASSWEDGADRLATSVIDSPNLWAESRTRQPGRSMVNHTEKPQRVVEQLLTYGCPPGGLVLDVFAGSCSTLVAARNSGRRAVGIELREEQCAKAVEWRLSQTTLPFGEVTA